MITHLSFQSVQKFWTLLLWFLLFFGAGGQSGFSQPFVEGYVVTNQGDTLFGQIRDAFAFNYTDSAVVIQSGSSEPQLYLPDELGAFYIGGKYRVHYVSKAIEELVADTIQTRKRFLKVLVLGRISLYLQSTGPNEFHFYLEKPELEDRLILMEVAEITYENEKTGKSQTKKVSTYLSVLNTVLLDCPGAYEAIGETKFKEKHLSQLIHQYNQCVEGAPSQNLFGKQGTLHRTGLILTNTLYLEELDDARLRRLLFEYGLFHQFVFPRLSKKWFFETRITHSFLTIKEEQTTISAHLIPLYLLGYSRNSLGKTQYYFNGGLVFLGRYGKRSRQITSTETLVEQRFGVFPAITAGAGIDFSLANDHRIKCELMFLLFAPRISLGYSF